MDLNEAYQILEVQFRSPLFHVSKAYKKLAMKYHPDKCKDANGQEQFLQIQKAFEYIKKNAPQLEVNLDSDLYAVNQPCQQPEPNIFDIWLTLEEIFTGVNRIEEITVKIVDANGCERRETKPLNVDVKPGYIAGSRILVEQKGDRLYGMMPANVIFIVHEKPHDCFKRIRFDLEYVVKLTTEQACNRQVMVPSLKKNGKKLQLTINQVITANTVERVPGKGLPIPNGNGKRGDLLIRFDIIYEKDTPHVPHIEKDFLLSINQILNGCNIKRKITQSIEDDDGNVTTKVYTISIDIKSEIESSPQSVNPNRGRNAIEVPVPTMDNVHNLSTCRIETPPGSSLSSLGDESKQEKSPETSEKELHQGFEYVDVNENSDESEEETLGEVETAKCEPNNDVKKSSEQLPANHYDIKLSLEEIYRGIVKEQEIVSQYTNSYGKVRHNSKTLKINIKPGSIDGTQIVCEFEGDQAYQKIPADVIFTIRENPHGIFKCIGHDLEYCAKITSREAFYGGNLEIPMLDGSFVAYAIKTPVQPGDRQKIEGRGLPIIDQEGQFGDLLVKFDITFEHGIVDPPITNDLNVSLEQILTGCTRHVKINRLILDRYGNQEEKVEILPIIVKPGTKEGTVYTYPRYGDQAIGHIPANISFKLKYKLHENFEVYGYDLLYKTEVFQSQVSKAAPFMVPTLKDGHKEICLENVDVRNNRKKISGQGLPKNDNSGKRGDLIVQFEIMDDPKDDPVHHNLEVTLEEILTGCLKKMKIKRKMFDPQGNELFMKAEVIPIQVDPGTPNGHKFTFPKLGDVHPGRTPADIVFTVCYKDHPFFNVKGIDLYYKAKLTNLEAQKCIPIAVPTLSGEMYNIHRKSILSVDVETLLGQGLPIFNNPSKRGKLFVRFDIYDKTFKDVPIQHDLVLTFEEMFNGCVKKRKIIQKIVDKYGNDSSTHTETVELVIPPGTEAGQRFICYRLGDDSVNRIPADIVFTTAQADHPIFSRRGFNLHYTATITKSEVQNGCHLIVPTLDGENKELNIKAKSIKPDSMREFLNLGFVNSETKKRGSLIVNFEVTDDPIEFPNMSPKNQSAELPQDEAIVYDLRLKLENILHGVEKRMRIKRRVTAEYGDEVDKEEIITIKVKPGTEAGTRFVFQKTGDQSLASLPADIVFVAVDVPHPLFTRQGKDIHYRATISRSQIAIGYDLQIPTLNEGTLTMPVKKESDISVPYSIPGYGLPGTKDCHSRGNLVVNFDVVSNQELAQQMDFETAPRPAPPIQEPATVIDLPMSLEDILDGYQTVVQLDRHTYDENGAIIRSESVPFPIVIPPGAPVDFPVIFPNQGHIKPGILPADVVFCTTEIRHKIFRRNGADIECTVPITYQQAKEGGTIMVSTLKGFKIPINLPSRIGPHSIQRIPELGLPYAEMPSKRGCLVVHFDIAEKKNIVNNKAFNKVVRLFDSNGQI